MYMQIFYFHFIYLLHTIIDIININTTAIDCLWIVTHIRHAPYGRRHVVPSAVSLAGVYASPAKPALAGV